MSDTPMMIQYKQIKAKHQDSILFFRLGDFYEMFFDDATIATSVLGLTLTGRGKDENRVPMCGIPFHAAEGYISKLVKEGYKVAVCEQVEDANESKGPTKRGVVRIITPGTAQLTPILDANQPNYLAAVCYYKTKYGLAYVDISTGAFFCDIKPSIESVSAELHRLNIKELLLDDKLTGQINHKLMTPFFSYEISQSRQAICDHFKIKSLAVFKLDDKHTCFPAISAILDYLNYTQKGAFSQLKSIKLVDDNQTCFFDQGVIDHLDIFHKKHGLFKLLNKTKTSMGARCLSHYLRYPLINKQHITSRQEQLQSLLSGDAVLNWASISQNINDIERLLSRICSKFQNPTDIKELGISINIAKNIVAFCETLGPAFHQELQRLNACYCDDNGLHELTDLLDSALNETVPTHTRDGGIFKPSYSQELHDLCQSFEDVRSWMNHLEPELKQSLDIKSLKIGFNKVFGYYIEIPNSQKDKVPNHFIRKQTLTNAERYITPELKEKETILLNAQSQQADLEKRLYSELESIIERYVHHIQQLASTIAHLDTMVALADSSRAYGFERPTVLEMNQNTLLFDGLWHPMVAENQDQQFIKNTINLPSSEPFMLITGPNMAGKSTIMRSVAIAILLGQVGCFVPAQLAEFSLVDAIYTRIGANDQLAQGQSTFMVEMIETATICQNATKHSLILLDEIGRGTSTFDGVSIAAAVTEYIVSHIGARTFFATHYHELTALADRYPQIQNSSMQIKETANDLVFAYKLIPGAAEKSYGVMVAKMAGLPQEIIDKADDWLTKFEKKAASGEITQLTLF